MKTLLVSAALIAGIVLASLKLWAWLPTPAIDVLAAGIICFTIGFLVFGFDLHEKLNNPPKNILAQIGYVLVGCPLAILFVLAAYTLCAAAISAVVLGALLLIAGFIAVMPEIITVLAMLFFGGIFLLWLMGGFDRG